MEKISIVIPLGIGRKVEYPESIKKQKEKIKVITAFGENPSENRNNGTKKAKSEFVAFINGHTVLDDKWSEKALEFFEKNKEIDIVGGPQMTAKDEKGFARASGYALASRFGAWKIANRYAGEKTRLDADETMVTSANLICRKKIFKKISFDKKMYPGEDPKFISDAKKAGFKIAYSPEIRVYNKRRGSFGELARQIFNYGKTRPEKESLKETLRMPFFLIPSTFIIYLLVLLIFSDISLALTGSVIGARSSNVGFILFLPVIFYILLSLIFSIANSIMHRNIAALFLLPFIFLTIHLSYGGGFLYSTLRKLKKKND